MFLWVSCRKEKTIRKYCQFSFQKAWPGTLEDLVPAPSHVILGQCLGPSPVFLVFADCLYSQSQPTAGTRLAVVVALKGGSRVYRGGDLKLVFMSDISAFLYCTVYLNSLQDLVSLCL